MNNRQSQFDIFKKSVANEKNVLYNTAMENKRKNKSNLEAESTASKKPKDPNADKIKKQFDEISRYQTKRENLLLGEYSADGKYSLTDDTLMQDLVSMPKVLQERVDNVVYAHTKYKGYNLNFKVELDISESYCSAEMFLIEIEHGVDEDIKHLTSLGNFVEMYSPSFKENVYKTWNINLQETPLDKDDVVFKNLKELEGEYNFSKELIEILSQLYIVRLLKLLDNCGTLGLKIQGDYRALVEELIRKDPSLAQDHTRLKQILDKMIAKHNGFDTILSKPEGAEILKNFSEPISRVTGKNVPILVDNGTQVEEKPAEKSAEKKEAPKKKKSKSKGGGDSIKPFVYDYKNYKPTVLAGTAEAKKILPSKETPAPVVQADSPSQRIGARDNIPRDKILGEQGFKPDEQISHDDEEVQQAEENFLEGFLTAANAAEEAQSVGDLLDNAEAAKQDAEITVVTEDAAEAANANAAEQIFGGDGKGGKK